MSDVEQRLTDLEQRVATAESLIVPLWKDAALAGVESLRAQAVERGQIPELTDEDSRELKEAKMAVFSAILAYMKLTGETEFDIWKLAPPR